MTTQEGDGPATRFGPDGSAGTGSAGTGPAGAFGDGGGQPPGLDLPVVRVPVVGPDGRVSAMDARPRIETEPGILGLSRRSRSRLGSRAFTLLFVVVFTLIVVQLVVALLEG